MTYTSVNYTLNHLVRLLSTPGLTFPKESQTPMLKVELGFLRTFLWWMGKRCPENRNLEGLLLQIVVVARNAASHLQSVPSDGSVEGIVKNMDLWCPEVLNRVQFLMPEVKKAYIKVAESSAPMPDQLVVEFISYLIENLKELLRYKKTPSTTFAERKEVGALVAQLRFLRNLLSFAATRCTDSEKLRDLSSLAEAIAVEAACLSFVCSFDPKDGKRTSSVKDKLAELLQKAKPITQETRRIYVGVLEALTPLATDTHNTSDPDLASFIDTLQDVLLELQEDQACWMASLKVNFEALHHDLTFLSSFVQDPPTYFLETDSPKDDPIQVLLGELSDWSTLDAHPFKHYTQHLTLKSQFTRIQDLAVKLGCTIFSYFYVNEMEVHKLAETEAALVDSVENMELLMSEIGVATFTLPEVNMVRIDDLGFIRSLCRNMRELLDRQADPVDSLKCRVQSTADELEILGSSLKDWGQRLHKHEKLRNLATHIVTVAYKAEYVIDSLLVRDGTLSYHLLCLIDIVGEMRKIRREVTVFHDKMVDFTEPKVVDSNVGPTIDMASLTISADMDDQLVVGLDEETQMLRSQLLRGSRQLTVIPIVGMPGIGKTTLAKKLFNDRRIGSHFDCRSFVKVSQVYERRKMLLQILQDVTGRDGTFNVRSEHELADMLRKSLIGKRYVIVLDDLWETSTWDDLRLVFPGNDNGSRILLTTRLMEVASFCTTSSDAILMLRLVLPSESWELLQRRIFQQETCPPELEEVGMRIAEQCQGLPLMIVFIADILARTERKVDRWEQVLENIPIDKSDYLDSIIEQKYQDMPDYLRQCFLYFGAFPEDEEIPVSELIRLWIAEGFVQQTEEKSLEDVAKDYLMDLITRNILTVSRRSSGGVVKSCKIHDSMRGLCLGKAKQEKLFHFIKMHDVFNSPHSVTCEHRRLVDLSKWGDSISSSISGPHVRSLVLTGGRSNFSRYDASFLYQNFKLLRVLDLGRANVGETFPVGVEKMVLLRYLAVQGEMISIPSSIGNLQQLETLVITGLQGEVAIPDKIWNLTNMRHLHVRPAASINPRQQVPGKLPNLRTLSYPSLSCGEDTLRRLPSLKRLKCFITKSGQMILPLDILSQLNSLKLIRKVAVPKSCELRLPSTLTRLTLSRFRLPWDKISMITRLANLEVLKLRERAFEGGEWYMEDEGFPKLKLLKLDTLDVEIWDASEESLPSLERLELHNCEELREIPLSLADIQTLKVIEVKWCRQSVAASALQIKEEVEAIEGVERIIVQTWE